MKKKRHAFLALFSLNNIGTLEYGLFALVAFLFASAPMYTDDASMHISLGFGFRLVFSFVLLFVTYALFLFFCDRSARGSTPDTYTKKGFDISRKSQSVVLLSLILLLCWIPYAVCLYPGVVFFDTSFQLAQFFGNPTPGIFPMPNDAFFTDHHPIFDTLLFGMFVKIGEIFGSANMGMYLFLIAQAILTALSFAYAISYFRNILKVKRSICFVAIAFFALCPIIPVFVFSMTKDSLFSWLYIIYLIQVIELVRSRGASLACPKKLVSIILVALLLSLTKKTGIYVVFLTYACLCIPLRKHLVRLVSVALTPLLVAAILVPALVFPLLSVASGSKVEVLGFFYQQTARYVVDYPDDVTTAEREAIANVLDFEHLTERYAPTITNPIKNVGTGANLWPTTPQIIDYVKCYISQGLRHPDAYFNAIASLESGWFDWSDTIKLATVSGLSLETDNGEPRIYRTSAFQALADKLNTVLSQIEFFFPANLLLKMPLYSIVIPLFSTLCLRKQKNGLLLAVLPVWISFLFLMMSPVSLASNAEAQRYLLPFVYSAPLVLALCAARPNKASLNAPDTKTQ